MPPTIQTGGRDDNERRRGEEKSRSELVCKVKYNNSLPDIPFDPKFITYPFEANRFVQYNPTSLERNYKHELLTEVDLGITVDLINQDAYKIDYSARLQVEDEKLLEDEVNTPQDSKRSRHHNKNVSWLRKTEYISTEYNRFTHSAEKAESRVGFNIKKYFKEENLYKDRESQIAAIEDTFDKVNKPITKHYSKPGVVALDVLPVFPDFQLWRHPCAQVIFDSDPSPAGRGNPAQLEEMSQAMIRGMVDESGDQFVAYFLPTEETIGKRKRDTENEVEYVSDEEYDYTLAREYNWNVKNKASKGYEESYFFVFKDTGVYYNELETRVRLSKRRKIGGGPASRKTRLLVKHRPLSEQEMAAQDARLMMLEPPQEEEEEVEVEEPANEAAQSGDENFMEGEKSGDERNDSGSEKSGGEERRSRSRSRSRSLSRSGSGSRSRSRSRSGSDDEGSGSGSDRGSGSGSESEAEEKKDAEEIFGSGSSSDSD